MTDDSSHIDAHSHSSRHRREIAGSSSCGCFYCCKVFAPAEIAEWVDEEEGEAGQTALCPYCGIDSVIGSESGYPITKEFLSRMRKHWFGSRVAAFFAPVVVIALSFGAIWLICALVGAALERITR